MKIPLKEFDDISHTPMDLPPSNNVEHTLDLVLGATLPNTHSYSLSPREYTKIESPIERLINPGHVKPSKPPCGSPTFMMPKKETLDWILVIDYKSLNKLMIKNRYPLPKIEDLLHQLQGAKFLTNIDIIVGYLQARMYVKDTWKTTLKTKFSFFGWMVMPFGLTNALKTFMHFINDIFSPHSETSILIYIDDILIFSIIWAGHMQ